MTTEGTLCYPYDHGFRPDPRVPPCYEAMRGVPDDTLAALAAAPRDTVWTLCLAAMTGDAAARAALADELTASVTAPESYVPRAVLSGWLRVLADRLDSTMLGDHKAYFSDAEAVEIRKAANGDVACWGPVVVAVREEARRVRNDFAYVPGDPE